MARCFREFNSILMPAQAFELWRLRDRKAAAMQAQLPHCQKCNTGILIPLSDYGQEGATVLFKAWVCINPACGFTLRIDKGEVSYGRKPESRH